jgi:predicted peptidase
MRYCLTFCLLLSQLFVQAQDNSLFKKELYTSGKDTLHYRILYPENYRKNRSYPVLIFLHGSGERGADNEAQLIHGASLFLKPETRKYFPAIVIFPQCPKDSLWSPYRKISSFADKTLGSLSADPGTPQRLVKELLDSMIAFRHVNARRVYMGGLSMGAFGVYDMLIRYPDVFAAAFTICGGSDIPQMVQRAKKIPLWIFHGEKDTVVPPDADRELYKALTTAGAPDVTYTEFPGVQHNSWDPAFAEPKLLPWLFSNKKKNTR